MEKSSPCEIVDFTGVRCLSNVSFANYKLHYIGTVQPPSWPWEVPCDMFSPMPQAEVRLVCMTT